MTAILLFDKYRNLSLTGVSRQVRHNTWLWWLMTYHKWKLTCFYDDPNINRSPVIYSFKKGCRLRGYAGSQWSEGKEEDLSLLFRHFKCIYRRGLIMSADIYQTGHVHSGEINILLEIRNKEKHNPCFRVCARVIGLITVFEQGVNAEMW